MSCAACRGQREPSQLSGFAEPGDLDDRQGLRVGAGLLDGLVGAHGTSSGGVGGVVLIRTAAPRAGNGATRW